LHKWEDNGIMGSDNDFALMEESTSSAKWLSGISSQSSAIFTIVLDGNLSSLVCVYGEYILSGQGKQNERVKVPHTARSLTV
jgi:hypothetical protein